MLLYFHGGTYIFWIATDATRQSGQIGCMGGFEAHTPAYPLEAVNTFSGRVGGCSGGVSGAFGSGVCAFTAMVVGGDSARAGLMLGLLPRLLS